MTEANGGPTLTPPDTAVSVSETQSKGASSRFQLPSTLQTIAFSTALAALTGVSASLGTAFASGRKDALGLYALTSDTIDERHVFMGIVLIAQVLVNALFVAIVARVLYLALGWIAKSTGISKRLRVPQLVRQHLWLLALLVVIADAFFLMGSIAELSKSAEGILFKNFSEIGDVWTRVIFEKTPDTASTYAFVYSGCLALFIWLCWWLVIKGIVQPIRKIVVSTLGIFVVFVTMLMFAYLSGAISTVKEYPVVTFSNHISLFGEDSVPILLGQDDKMFAFLVVLAKAKPEDPIHKMIVYIPRSEVKYMAVLRTVPLYMMDKHDDLQRLQEEMKGRTK